MNFHGKGAVETIDPKSHSKAQVSLWPKTFVVLTLCFSYLKSKGESRQRAHHEHVLAAATMASAVATLASSASTVAACSAAAASFGSTSICFGVTMTLATLHIGTVVSRGLQAVREATTEVNKET